jgi:hypothetical protein
MVAVQVYLVMMLFVYAVDEKVPSCTWLTPTDQDYVMQCNDGTFCNAIISGWSCCNKRNGRAKCPKNKPLMCAAKACASRSAYCCEKDCFGHGGLRKCAVPTNLQTASPTAIPSTAPTDLPTFIPTLVPTEAPSTSPTAPTAVPKCSWVTPTDQNYVFQCNDGTFCNAIASGWNCCGKRQGRAKCPKNMPLMCAAEKACASRSDYCCERDCSYYGGLRKCALPTNLPTAFPTDAPTWLPTRAPTSSLTDMPSTPSYFPTFIPTQAPTESPSASPAAQTMSPTPLPNPEPSSSPTDIPSTPSSTPTAKSCIDKLMSMTKEMALENCPARFPSKSFGICACRSSYQQRLDLSLANQLYGDCRSRCVYDYQSMIADEKGAFLYRKRAKCYKYVKKGGCFKLEKYVEVIKRAKKLC